MCYVSTIMLVDEQKGIIDKETDDKLREVLTEEEYELISQKTSKQVDRVQIKLNSRNNTRYNQIEN